MPPDPYNDLLSSVLGPRPKSARDKVHRIASRVGISPDIADDFLKVTGGIESSNRHYDRSGRVLRSPAGALGFSQVLPATAKQYGLDPYDEDQNIEAGLRYFSEGGTDPVARRIGYLSGHHSGAVKSYRRTGRIPRGGDPYTGVSFNQYVQASRGQRVPDEYDSLLADVLGGDQPPTPAPAPATGRFAGMARATEAAKRRPRTEPMRVPLPSLAESATAGAGPLVHRGQGAGALRQLDQPEVARIMRTQRQVAAEPDRLANARLFDPKLNDAEEAARRASEERQAEVEQAARDAEYQRNKPEINRLAATYRQAIRGVTPINASSKWVNETVAKGVAPLVEKVAGIGRIAAAGGSPGAQVGVDQLRLHAQALQQAAMEEGASRTEASKFVQDIAGGFIGTAPELAAMSAGVPAPLAFAGGEATHAYGRGEPVIPAAAHGALTGAAFEIPVGGKGLSRAARRAGTTGAATAAVELGTGRSPRDAAVTGLTNAALVGLPELARGGRRNAATVSETKPAEQEGQRMDTDPRGVSADRGERPTAATEAPSVGDQPASTPQRFYHKDWGEVVEVADQSGARQGRVKVAEVANPDALHYPKKSDLRGVGNSRMVPVKAAEPTPSVDASMFLEAEEGGLAELLGNHEKPKTGLVEPEPSRGIGEQESEQARSTAAAHYKTPEGRNRAAKKIVDDLRQDLDTVTSGQIRELDQEMPVRPAPLSLLQSAKRSTGSDPHPLVDAITSKPEWSKGVLAEVGEGAQQLRLADIADAGLAKSDPFGAALYFRTKKGDIVKISKASASELSPTFGDRRQGIVVERIPQKAEQLTPQTLPIAQPPVSPKQAATEAVPKEIASPPKTIRGNEEQTSLPDQLNPRVTAPERIDAQTTRDIPIQTKAGEMKANVDRPSRNELTVWVKDSEGRQVGEATFNRTTDGWSASYLFVDKDMRRHGIASAMYDVAESQGLKLKPAQSQTKEAAAFWDARNTKAEPYFHLTQPKTAEIIRREGFKPSENGELGPGVYLTNDPTMMTDKRFAETERIPIDVKTKILDVKYGANTPLQVLKAIHGHEKGTEFYDQHQSDIWGGGQPNWKFLHGQAAQAGFGGLRLEGSASPRNVVVFDPALVAPSGGKGKPTPKLRAPEGFEVDEPEKGYRDQFEIARRSKELIKEGYKVGIASVGDKSYIVKQPLNAKAGTARETVSEAVSPSRDPITERAMQGGGEGVSPEALRSYPDIAAKYPSAARDVMGLRESAPPINPPAVQGEREPSTTSARKAQFATDRAELDLPELPPAERKSWQKTLDNARDRLLPERASLLADEVLNKPRALTDEETAGLVLRAQTIKNQHKVVMDKIGKAKDEAIPALKSEADALEREFDRLTRATKASGTEKGRALASQKLTINQDYDLISMVQRAKAVRGRELKPEERVTIERQAKEIEELSVKLAAAEERAAADALQKQIDRVVRKGRRTEKKQTLDDEFKELVSQFRKPQGPSASLGPEAGVAVFDAEAVVLIGKMARNRVRAGVNTAEGLVDEVYNAVKDHVAGVTKRDVRDAISGYGLEPRPDRRSEVAQQLAQVRGELKRLSAQEDIAAGRRSVRREGPPNMPKIEATRNQMRQSQLHKQEAELQRRLTQGDYSTPPKREPPQYNRETYALQKRIDEIKQQYSRAQYRATRSVGGRITDELAKAANIPKTIKSMGDLSAMFRQGGFFALTHPIEGLAKPTRDMLRSFSDLGYQNVERAIRSDANFETAKRSGVEFTGVDKADPKLSHREEGYLASEHLDYVPGLKQIKDFSERTFVSFLDSQRMHMFNQMVEGLSVGQRQNPAELKAIARLINSATGRGNLGVRGNQIAPVLNIAMFSPRLLKSRVELLNNMFNPVRIARMPPGARARMIKDNVKFLAATAAFMGLAKAAGATVNTNPDDGDFLKIRFGAMTYDTLTGLQQPLRYIINMGRAVKADIAGTPYEGKSKADLTGRFARSKLSPLAGSAMNYLTGRDYQGREFSLKREALETVTPLPAHDVIEAMQQEGLIKGGLKAAPSLLGIGVNTYLPRPSASRPSRPTRPRRESRPRP